MTAVYQSKLKIGESKHLHKIKGDETDWIFSWSTYRAYTKHARYFLNWAKQNYKCKTLQQARQYADEWLQTRFHLSSYTVKLELAALCKLYGDTAADYIPTPPRLRKNIKRSRGKAARDAHFSEARNAEFVEFCRSTGLRRSEIKALTGDKLEKGADGYWYINVNKMTKGGRPRKVRIIGTDEAIARIVERMQNAGSGRVFEKIPSCDIHGYRSEFATAVYKQYARPVKSLPPEERYCCRFERAGIWYDRKALLETSLQLGHNRVCVVGEHYLNI